ncbi:MULTISPECIES: sporulation integral membrane protein YlbJ [Clostridium]|uniref:Sporulation integral membrane protein YlbJ n=1 Tax=Clostridium cibarium TaxID=2762247 RepID=A0ABR8PQG6_9CLOT|nr:MULTISPECIES: sporulation integral membrane protein YlbJ [Clostridium]MBD7910414.1 sporulation integral membrane protein YlbJ [Clostridium cibarium]
MISIVFLWLLIIILIPILFKMINLKKNYIICFFISIMIVVFLINLEQSMKSAIDGCKLWFKSILPTVLPFTLICNLLISYDGIGLYSKFLGPLFCKPLGLSKNCSFPITASILCGYPLGAKYSSDIYNLGYIDRDEYTRLLNIATNCGPLFIIGPIGTAMLGNIKLSYLLLIANYISPIIIGILTKKHNIYKKTNIPIPKFHAGKNFGEILKESLDQAINTTISIGGFIVIFSIIIGIIKHSANLDMFFNKIELLMHIPVNSLYSVILGSIEITNGCNLIATSNLILPIKLSTISFLCSFSGLCIIAQASSFISKDKISLIKYSLIKLLQGIISFFITLIVSYLFLGSVNASSIFTCDEATIPTFMYFIPLITLLAITLTLKGIKKLFFHIS